MVLISAADRDIGFDELGADLDTCSVSALGGDCADGGAEVEDGVVDKRN